MAGRMDKSWENIELLFGDTILDMYGKVQDE